MSDSAENLSLIAASLDRIANSLEYFAQLAAANQPQPKLRIGRSSTDDSNFPAVNLSDDGRLNVNFYNDGSVATEISKPEVTIGETVEVGGLIGNRGLPMPSGTASAASGGVIVFELTPAFVSLYADAVLQIRIPHSPGRFPTGTILVVDLRPDSYHDGRYGWSVISSREVPANWSGSNATA